MIPVPHLLWSRCYDNSCDNRIWSASTNDASDVGQLGWVETLVRSVETLLLSLTGGCTSSHLMPEVLLLWALDLQSCRNLARHVYSSQTKA